MPSKGLPWAVRFQEGLPETHSLRENRSPSTAREARGFWMPALGYQPRIVAQRLAQETKACHLAGGKPPQSTCASLPSLGTLGGVKPDLSLSCQLGPGLLPPNSCPPQTRIHCDALWLFAVLPGSQAGSLCDLRNHGTVQQAQLPVLRAAAPLPHLSPPNLPYPAPQKSA